MAAWQSRTVVWAVVGILMMVSIESAISAFTYPYFSLALEKFGLSNWMIGLNASVAGAGILLIGPFLPRMIAAVGLQRLSAAMFGLPLVCFAAMLVVDHVAVWFVARFVMGACFAALWAVTEIWLNGVASDRQRGRILSLAMILYTAAQFVGPLSVSLTGVSGILPFVIVMTPLAVGLIIALTIRATGTATVDSRAAAPINLRAAFALAGGVIVITFFVGIASTSALSLLPLYGLLQGLSDRGAADLVVIFSLGEALFVGLFGLLADRYDRRHLLRLCAIPTLLVAAALPLSLSAPVLLNPLLFLAGGTLGGIYMLCLILIGQDFRGQALAVVSTAFAMSYSAGSVVGSTPIGFLIDVFGPTALPLAIAASLMLLAYLVVRGVPTQKTADATTERSLPSLAVNQAEFVNVEHAKVGDLQMRNHRKRQERDLEEWFLKRAAKVTRRVPQRYEAGTNRLERPQAHQSSKRKSKLRKDSTA